MKRTTAAATIATAPTTISQQVAIGGQKATFLEVLDDRAGFGVVWQIRIVSDSYRSQCSAVIQKWTGDEWAHVHAILPDLMQTRDKLYVQPGGVTARDFAQDRAELLRVARAIKRAA